ncbi:MAG: hypothetical protein ACI8W1_002557 [Candidatus Azotimanducaceae bacterium]|jgi:hypothetical protein
MIVRTFSLLATAFVILALVGCGSTTARPALEDLKVSAATQEIEQKAKAFSALDEAANVYIRMNDNWLSRIPTIWVNDTKVGIFDEKSFLNFSASPGLYDIRVAYDRRDLTNNRNIGWLISNFDLQLDPGAIVLIDCDRVDVSLMGYVRTNDPVLQKISPACDGEFNSNERGVSSCTVPYSETGTLDMYTYGTYGLGSANRNPDTSLGACRLITDPQEFATMGVSQPLVEHVYSETYVYEQALSQNTIAVYQSFINDWPNSTHVADARSAIQRIQQQNEIDAWENQIASTLQRDSALPLQAQRDKYMIALTGYLQNQDFQPSLLYFELLERMNLELPDSLTHFWGEALLRTGDPQGAIEKLYEYVSAAGTSGAYYRDALTLINEAEQL